MARWVRSTFGLGSVASEVYAENRSDDPLWLARDSADGPARQYRADDAWKGLAPASEADDVEVTSDPESWTTPMSVFASWVRPNDSWVESWNAATAAAVQAGTWKHTGHVVVGTVGVGAFLLGARTVGTVLVVGTVLDMVAQKLIPAWARVMA